MQIQKIVGIILLIGALYFAYVMLVANVVEQPSGNPSNPMEFSDFCQRK